MTPYPIGNNGNHRHGGPHMSTWGGALKFDGHAWGTEHGHNVVQQTPEMRRNHPPIFHAWGASYRERRGQLNKGARQFLNFRFSYRDRRGASRPRAIGHSLAYPFSIPSRRPTSGAEKASSASGTATDIKERAPLNFS